MDRTSILDGLYTEMLSILTIHLLHDSTVISATSQLGGTQIVWQHVLHGMVLFGTTTGCVLRSLTCGSAQHGNSSITQSVQPDEISGLSGKITSPLFQLTIHGLPPRSFDALSSTTPIPGRRSAFSGLTIQTPPQGTIQWHSGGSTFHQLGRIPRGPLTRRSLKR